mgnify:CR=1 FL=1
MIFKLIIFKLNQIFIIKIYNNSHFFFSVYKMSHLHPTKIHEAIINLQNYANGTEAEEGYFNRK